MRTAQIFLVFLSLLSLSLAAGSSPGAAAGSSSSRSGSSPGAAAGSSSSRTSASANRAGNGGTSEPQTPHTSKNEKTREPESGLPETGRKKGMTDPSENQPEPSDSDDPESPPGDGDDPTPTKTSKSTSKTTTAQRQRSTTFEAKVDGMLTTMTDVEVSFTSTGMSTPTSLSLTRSTRPSTAGPTTIPAPDRVLASGAGMDSADVSLLGLLVAVGMGVLVY